MPGMFIFIVTCQLPGRIGDCVCARTVHERAMVSRAIELNRDFHAISLLADLKVGYHGATTYHLAYGHNHAAPRTPLESPWRAATIGVSAESEKTKGFSSGGTRVYSREMLDTPPPSTMTSGSSTLMILASARASCVS